MHVHVYMLSHAHFFATVWTTVPMGVPGGSDGTESTCNVGNPGLIPGSEDLWRREQKPTPVFFRASLVAHRVKRLPATRETRVRSLGQEDPLEKEIATHSSTLAWRIPWTEEPGSLQTMGSQSWTRLSNFTSFLSFFLSFNPWIFLPNCSSKDQQNSLSSHYWSTKKKKKMLLHSLKIHELSIPETC